MTHHAASFRRAVRDNALADAVASDASTAPIAAPDRALIKYARELTLRPAGDSSDRVAALRAAGIHDEAILAATEIIGYFNFVTRMAHGLGVELE